MIVFAIKSYFFSRADNYSLRHKPHILYFFYFFCGKIIKIVCAILAIAMKDLKVCLDNLNLLLGKNVIWFDLLAQKRETSK